MSKALDVQVGGSHYKNLKIQPVEYIRANNIGYFEGNVIKYITRWKQKNGIEDLKKVLHYTQLLIEFEEKEINASKDCSGQQEPQREADCNVRAGVSEIHPCRTDDTPSIQPQRTVIPGSSNEKVHGASSSIADNVGKEQGWYEQQRVTIPFTGGHVSFPLEGQRVRGSSIDFPADKDRASQAMVKQTFGVATKHQGGGHID